MTPERGLHNNWGIMKRKIKDISRNRFKSLPKLLVKHNSTFLSERWKIACTLLGLAPNAAWGRWGVCLSPGRVPCPVPWPGHHPRAAAPLVIAKVPSKDHDDPRQSALLHVHSEESRSRSYKCSEKTIFLCCEQEQSRLTN